MKTKSHAKCRLRKVRINYWVMTIFMSSTSIKFSDQLILKFEVMSRVEVYKTVLFKESNLSMIKPLKMRERMYGIKNFLMILKVLGGIKY